MVTENSYNNFKTIGIAAHSYEGGTLAFLTACREGAKLLGPHMHPNVVASAIPMALSMEAWESDDYKTLGRHHGEGITQVHNAGADFFICPDNTSHLAIEKIIDSQPIPGLHIAEVVCHEIAKNGWAKVGLLGTKWTMNGPVYPRVFEKQGFDKLIPDGLTQHKINEAIFEELCQSIFRPETIKIFEGAIGDLKDRGAECVILGCTEIPLIINSENAVLPTLDSTRLLAKYAVQLATSTVELPSKGWIAPESFANHSPDGSF